MSGWREVERSTVRRIWFCGVNLGQAVAQAKRGFGNSLLILAFVSINQEADDGSNHRARGLPSLSD